MSDDDDENNNFIKQILPHDDALRLLTILYEKPNEHIIKVTVPSYWISNRILIILSSLGTFGFLVMTLVMFILHLNLQWLFLGISPLILLAVLFGLRTKRLVIFTSEKLVIYKLGTVPVQVPYESIVTLENRLNWMFLMRELCVRKTSDKTFSPTTISKQSGVKQEFIDGFTKQDLAEMESLIRDRMYVCKNLENNEQQQQLEEEEEKEEEKEEEEEVDRTINIF